jgi:osmoprotectant transport system substrate-binding protein
MKRKRVLGWGLLAAAALAGSSCGGSKKPIVIGSKDTTVQAVLGEIVAQHLEHRLGRKVGRSLGLGNTPSLYQALTNGEIGMYPEETGTIQTTILKETPSSDASSTLERVRNEMRRISQFELMDPLGIDSGWAIVVSKDSIKSDTISDAAGFKTGWKLGVTRDFSERRDGLAALNQYRLPIEAAPRVSDPASLYGDLAEGKLTMVAGNATDGYLARHDEWKELRDDKKVFAYYQTCLMVRADLLASDSKIQPALQELSGRITNETIRKLAAEVGIDHKKPADVAAKFLSDAGLK